MTEISVAVCTHDRPALLERCLGSVWPQIDAQSELIVVDSAPSGPGVESIAAAVGARYVMTPRRGLDVARNLALYTAKGAIIAFIDDDAVAAPGWLEGLRGSFADPSVACVTGRVLPLELKTPAQAMFEERYSFDRGPEPMRFTVRDDRLWYPIHPWHLGTGCNMAFRRHVFDQIGPFDEALDMGTPVGGGGDIDIFRRLLWAGFVAVYNPEALVYHQHRESMTDLRRQFWGYGKALTALMIKALLLQRDAAREAGSLLFHRFRIQGRRFARRLLKGQGAPLSLILAESLGHLVGPVAFLHSLRRVQREQRRYPAPAQLYGSQLDRGPSETLEVEEDHSLYRVVNLSNASLSTGAESAGPEE
jgi:GT2 family glycosyltransferase